MEGKVTPRIFAPEYVYLQCFETHNPDFGTLETMELILRFLNETGQECSGKLFGYGTVVVDFTAHLTLGVSLVQTVSNALCAKTCGKSQLNYRAVTSSAFSAFVTGLPKSVELVPLAETLYHSSSIFVLQRS